MKKFKKRKSSASSFSKRLDTVATQTGLKSLPVPALVATLDSLIGILQERGFFIRDWDEKEKVVQRVKVIGGKIYLLAPREKQEAQPTGK